jgi:hypothetical protein
VVTGEELLEAARFDLVVGPCRVFDQRFAIHTTDAGVAGFLAELYAATLEEDPGPGGAAAPITRYRFLPPQARDDGGDERGLVARDDEVLVTSARPSTLLGRLVWAINRQVIDGSADRLLFHAAAAELDGVGVLIPADMEAGKTTLMAGLMDRGAAYLTDEAAAVDPEDLTLEGFPKPLSIDRGSWEVLAHRRPEVLDGELADYLATQWQVSGATMGRVAQRTTLGLVVFRRFVAGEPTTLTALAPADAVQRAVACTFVTDRDHLPVGKLRALASIIERVPAFELVGGDLDAAGDAVLEALAAVQSWPGDQRPGFRGRAPA